jgi:hypothetical protein
VCTINTVGNYSCQSVGSSVIPDGTVVENIDNVIIQTQPVTTDVVIRHVVEPATSFGAVVVEPAPTNWWVWLIAGLALLFLLGIVFYFLFWGGSSADTSDVHVYSHTSDHYYPVG